MTAKNRVYYKVEGSKNKIAFKIGGSGWRTYGGSAPESPLVITI